MPPYTVQPCTYTDAVSIAENNVPAFWLDAAWVLIWTRVHKTCSYVTSQSALRSPQNLLSDPEHRRHEKVVDGETGKLVGYCRWLLPNDLGDGVRSEEVWNEARIGVEDVSEEDKAIAKEAYGAADWGFDHALDTLDEPMSNRKKELIEGKNYMLLDYLAVHPDYQGKGIASMLVKSGLQQVDKYGFACFVLAKNAALGIYQKAGFVLLDQVVGDYSEFGLEEKFNWSMLEYKVKK